MDVGKNEKIDQIVALAEKHFPEGEYRDRAYDAVTEDPDCIVEDVAHRLAMEAAYP